MVDVAAPPDHLTLPRVAIVLAAIAILAGVVPYVAVRTMHAGRLRAADGQQAAIADAVAQAAAAPGLYAGVGTVPVLQDSRWSAAPLFPLSRLQPPGAAAADPWGNAFLVVVRGRSGAEPRVAVLSAGADGILQTPFQWPPAVAGDDRLTTR